MPVPVRSTSTLFWPLAVPGSGSFDGTSILPTAGPTTVGVKRRMIEQLPPGSSVWPLVQLPPRRENGATGGMSVPSTRLAVPLLATMTVWVEKLPSGVLPNATGRGVTLLFGDASAGAS